VFAVLRFGARGLARGRDLRIGAREDLQVAPLWGLWLPVVAGALTAAAAAAWAAAQVPGKFGVMGVLLVVPCVGFFMGTLSGLIIVKGRLQPFIVTLAMMVAVLGVARLTAGQDTAVYPVYTGSNATAEFEVLRSVLFGVLPVPGLFFLVLIGIFMAMLRATTFGRYVYAIGGNEEATRLSGVNVDRVKVTVYAFSGMLAALAGVLYVAQYRQGKPDAGAGIELDAIAAVAIGGTSLMGGKGSLAGTFVGVLIFGLLSNILQLNNIDSNMQLVLKGAIIILAVLLQEGSLNLFRSRPRPAQVPARPTDAAGYAVAGGTGSTKDG
jgi:simple sugar transport system permease protein